MRSTINQYFMWQCLFDLTETLFLLCETVQRLAITLSLSFRSKSFPANHSGLAHPFSSIFLCQKLSMAPTCKRNSVSSFNCSLLWVIEEAISAPATIPRADLAPVLWEVPAGTPAHVQKQLYSCPSPLQVLKSSTHTATQQKFFH